MVAPQRPLEPKGAPVARAWDLRLTPTLRGLRGAPLSPTVERALPVEDYEEAESACDGIDSDCDGAVDEELMAPLALQQEGVCSGQVKVCMGENGWVEPDYFSVSGYEETELLCDGVDNDCDGVVDEVPNAPLAMKQNGVCVGSTQRCDEDGGWLEPDYTQVEGYGEEQCDGLDNDCDGITDETPSNAPLADLQEGVCAESVKACVEGAWVEPEYERISMFSTNDSSCDQLDNDCDGSTDEEREYELFNM